MFNYCWPEINLLTSFLLWNVPLDEKSNNTATINPFFSYFFIWAWMLEMYALFLNLKSQCSALPIKKSLIIKF